MKRKDALDGQRDIRIKFMGKLQNNHENQEDISKKSIVMKRDSTGLSGLQTICEM